MPKTATLNQGDSVKARAETDMSDDETAIAELRQRVDAIEKELGDKRATDAFLYLMISASSRALMGLLELLKASLSKQPAGEISAEVKSQSSKFDENSKEAEKLIWGDEDDTGS